MTLKTLLIAMVIAESNGNTAAIGDNGNSYGCLQLTEAYVKDAAEWAKEDWVHEDAFDMTKSFKIFTAYIERYATEERIGRSVTPEDIARIHNGGPDGYKKKSTEKYWERVKQIIEANKYANSK